MPYADLTGQRARVSILRPGSPWPSDEYDVTITAGPDFTGTITFRADDGRDGVAGLGAWVLLR